MKSLLKSALAVVIYSLLFGCGEYYASDSHAKNLIHEHQETDPEAKYSVNEQTLNITLMSGVSGEEDVKSWQKLITILPNEALKKHVAEYHVFSDGEANNLAYVTNIDNDDSKWIFALDYDDASNLNAEYIEEFVLTIVHEFSHIISLEIGEVDRDYTSCTTYKIDEGCTKSTSYLNLFYQEFWQSEEYRKYQQSLEGINEKNQETIITQFYEAHPDRFVNEYSATNPVEDFAESFTFFVLSDKVVKPNTLQDTKLNFFYRFPKLVSIRNDIRDRTYVRK